MKCEISGCFIEAGAHQLAGYIKIGEEQKEIRLWVCDVHYAQTVDAPNKLGFSLEAIPAKPLTTSEPPFASRPELRFKQLVTSGRDLYGLVEDGAVYRYTKLGNWRKLNMGLDTRDASH